ncbi:S27A2 synthetase, partial [Bucco capensis]|nr:S27A2 synthetase [Bucco capensis]
PPVTLLELFRHHVSCRPQHHFLRFQDEIYTYQQMDSKSNQAARVLQQRLQLAAGHSVAVFLPNEPSYVWSWLGLAKLGWPMACLNCNVRGQGLRHALRCANATSMLTCPGETCMGAWGEP